MNFLKRWASIQKWTRCRTSLQCPNRIFVGLFRKSSVLLSHWVCARLRSIQISLHLTNQSMVYKQSCRWLTCRMLPLQRLMRQKLSHWVMLASDRNQLASSKSEKVSNLLMKFVTMFRSMSWESTFVILVFSWVMLWILWLWTLLSMVTTLMALSLPR